MMYPPSLPPDVRDRGFVADNGELGILLSDTQAFLNACRADNLTVFGWELWIIDYEWGKDNAPVSPRRVRGVAESRLTVRVFQQSLGALGMSINRKMNWPF
jgi:hypothetical protein